MEDPSLAGLFERNRIWAKSVTDRMARALTWRIGLSVVLFLLLLAGFASGVLQPHQPFPASPAGHNQ